MSSESDLPGSQPDKPRQPHGSSEQPQDHAEGGSHSHPHRHGAGARSRPFFGRGIVWAVIILILLLIGGCLLLRGSSGKKKAPPAAVPIPVSAAPVKTGNIDVTLNALGIVTPVYTVTVTSRVGGELTEIHYREGQKVKKNDLLIVIDPGPYQAAVTQAEGQLERDRALLENARIDLSRYENAVKSHAIPEQLLATQQALVREDGGTVKLDQGNLDAAKVNLAYTRIRSPIDGQVGLRLVDPGNNVAANGTTPLVTITQLQPITVIFTVAEDYIGEITREMHPGHGLRVDALDRSQQTKIAQGQLETIDNQINTSTGTVRARASFANAKGELFPNQFVNARIFVKTLTQVDLIPTAAIQRNDTAAFVYIIQADGTVKSQPITVTDTEGDVAAVTGVKPGDQLVTDGFEKLQDGSKVAVRQPGARNQAPLQPQKSEGDNQNPTGEKSGGS